MDTRDSRCSQLSNAAREFLFFSFTRLFFPTKQNKGHRGNWDTILQRCVHCGRKKVWVGFCKDLTRKTCRLAGCSLSLWRLTSERSALVRGPLDFRIVQEKIALSLKDFSRWGVGAREGGKEGGRRRVSRSPFSVGGGGDEHKANNLSACLLGTWRRQHLCLAQPLSKSYFTFGWIYFSVKQKQKKRKKTLCKGSCQLQ